MSLVPDAEIFCKSHWKRKVSWLWFPSFWCCIWGYHLHRWISGWKILEARKARMQLLVLEFFGMLSCVPVLFCWVWPLRVSFLGSLHWRPQRRDAPSLSHGKAADANGCFTEEKGKIWQFLLKGFLGNTALLTHLTCPAMKPWVGCPGLNPKSI